MIIVICGPTGVGKTKLSVELAKRMDGEIINADSTQIYKYMDIGTAKVTKAETEGIKHHLLSFLEPNEEYTIYEYQRDARRVLNDLLDKGKTPIIVGGSNLYIKSLLYNYKLSEEKSNISINLGNEEMYNSLINKIPNISIDKNNRRRLERAYIKYIINNEELNNDENNLVYSNVVFIGLTTSRDKLYEIINNRVDKMISGGLIKEVEDLVSKYGITRELNTAIGYKEIIKYLNGDISLEDAISLIKKNSRHYAKRQYTWLNNKMKIIWFDVDFSNFNNTVNEVIDYIGEKQCKDIL